MALIARTEALASQLASDFGANAPQLWLDPDHGIVGGVFPIPVCRFDFATERTVRLHREEPATLIQVASAGTKKRISMLHQAKRVGTIYEVETKDAIYVFGSATQMLIEGLNILEEVRPGTLEKLSHHKKQSKRPVARTRSELYEAKHPDSHSSKLNGGWYVATNNKANEAKGVLMLAVELAKLDLKKDFIINER